MKLEAQKREITGKAVKRLRLEGKVPAVLYGHGITPRSIFVLYNPFKKVLSDAGESTLVDLYIDSEPHKVLIQDVSHDPISGLVTHVDFREVSMTEKLETDITLKFVGDSRAVKELGGVLLKTMNEVKVRCLPSALVHEIEVDLSPLREFGNSIHISDLRLPEGIEILENPTQVVIAATAPREEEVAAPVAAEAPDLSAIKTVGEEKRAAKAAEKEAEAKAEGKTEK